MVTRWEVESDILVISAMLKGQETCVNKSSVMFSGAGGAHNLLKTVMRRRKIQFHFWSELHSIYTNSKVSRIINETNTSL